jgi:hypothetical protein
MLPRASPRPAPAGRGSPGAGQGRLAGPSRRSGSPGCWPARSGSPAPRWWPPRGGWARCTRTMKGTDMKAPPAPTSPDTSRCLRPTHPAPAAGHLPPGLGLRSSSIWVAEKPTNSAKNRASPALEHGEQPAPDSRPPTRCPVPCCAPRPSAPHPRMVGAHAGHRGEQDGGHRGGDGHLHRQAGLDPAADRIQVMKGTINMPPPMPSRPARKPVCSPGPAVRRHQQKVSRSPSGAAQSPSSSQHGCPFGARDRGDRQPVAALQQPHAGQLGLGAHLGAAPAGGSCAPAHVHLQPARAGRADLGSK